MSSRLIAFATLALIVGGAAAQAADDGFATRSVTGMGLTGETSSNGSGAASGTTGSPKDSSHGAGPVGSGTVSGSVGIGMGAGAPAAGGGTFGTPKRN